MNKDLSEIVVIFDRSGSMQSIINDAVGGLNALIEENKRAPGQANFTLAAFDDRYDLLYSGVDLRIVPEITTAQLQPRGMTALYDAIGKTIAAVGERLANTPDHERPSKVIVAIVTDGQENASKEYLQQAIFDMIEHQRIKYSWEFMFLAANQDAMKVAADIAIPMNCAANYNPTAKGVSAAYSTISTSCSLARAGGKIDLSHVSSDVDAQNVLKSAKSWD